MNGSRLLGGTLMVLLAPAWGYPKYPSVIKGGKLGNPLETGGSIAIGKSSIVPKRSCIFQPAMFDDWKVATFSTFFKHLSGVHPWKLWGTLRWRLLTMGSWKMHWALSTRQRVWVLGDGRWCHEKTAISRGKWPKTWGMALPCQIVGHVPGSQSEHRIFTAGD